MSTALELVYEYRRLIGKCWTGCGLSMDEIEAVEAIEGLFAVGASPLGGADKALGATLRSGRRNYTQRAELLAATLEEVEVALSSALEPGTQIELCVEDHELRLSYRFKGRVVLTRDAAAGGHVTALQLIGIPILVRRGPKQPKPTSGRRLGSEPRVVAA